VLTGQDYAPWCSSRDVRFVAGLLESQFSSVLCIEMTVDAIAQEVLRAHAEHYLEGVTFSGGEPMQQADSLLGLMHSLRRQSQT